jgi:biopolymer transport protein ExbD
MRKRRSAKRFPMPEVSLTPLIDATLTILVIFMITVPAVQNSIKVNLPTGVSQDVAEKQDLVVTLDKDSNIFFNSFSVDKDKLVLSVKEAIKGKETSPIWVRADESLSYGSVVGVVDLLKQSGAKTVSMSMAKHQKSPKLDSIASTL